MKKSLELYFKLMEDRPELFKENKAISIITDKKTLENYPEDIGVVYESKYLLVIRDLVKDFNGNIYTHERNALPRKQKGVVGVIEYEGKILMLKQFRHPVRKYVYDFVSGLGEEKISSKTNMIKEINEEIGGEVLEIQKIGSLVSDVGVSSDSADIFKVKTNGFHIDKGYEGIKEVKLFSVQEIKDLIKDGKIDDSLTIGAFSLYLLSIEQ